MPLSLSQSLQLLRHLKIFSLVIESVPIKKKENKKPGKIRTVGILNCLPYHDITTPTFQNSEKVKYINQQTVFLNWYISNRRPKLFLKLLTQIQLELESRSF